MLLICCQKKKNSEVLNLSLTLGFDLRIIL